MDAPGLRQNSLEGLKKQFDIMYNRLHEHWRFSKIL